ncbi:bacterial low temperature requirement A protein-domain-containing protein [Hyaloraphidium curvatum]|nr:bacterial low temperature requirement A protein-domain-containing protein [Hyaloraphidium curvatum]
MGGSMDAPPSPLVPAELPGNGSGAANGVSPAETPRSRTPPANGVHAAEKAESEPPHGSPDREEGEEEDDDEGVSITSEYYHRAAGTGTARSTTMRRSARMNQIVHGGKYLRTGPKERRVGWDELFFDLLYVYLVRLVGESSINSEFFGYLADPQQVLQSMGRFFLLFYPVWISWFLTQLYTNLYHQEGIAYRISFMIHVVAIVGLASVIPTVLPLTPSGAPEDDASPASSSGRAFVFFFAFNRAELVFQNLVRAFVFPRFAKIFLFRTVALVLPLALYVAWIFVGHATALWWSAVALDIFLIFAVDPFVAARAHARPATDQSHWSERLGLFTLIVLGEQVQNVVWEQQAGTFAYGPFFASVLGVLPVWVLWRLYSAAGRGYRRHAVRRGPWFESAWSFLHLPMQAAMVAAAAGLHLMLDSTFPTGTTAEGRRLAARQSSGYNRNAEVSYFLSTLFSLLSIGLIGLLHLQDARPRERWLRAASLILGGGLVAIPVGLKGGFWAVLGTTNFVLWVLYVGWEAWEWWKAKKRGARGEVFQRQETDKDAD